MNMESPAAGKNGRIAQLHSRYKPREEARKYIDSLSLNSEIEYFILLEPGCGYITEALKNRCPAAKIAALHVDASFRPHETETAWYPDCAETMQEFLEREIPDAPAAAIRIIEWRPSLNVYGTKYLNALSEAVDFIKRADAGYRTSADFGRRWVRNFFKNLSLVSRALKFKATEKPALVTGSGPGLEAALPRIRAMKSRVLLIASSSSVTALHQGGICPDLVISTDGGAWAHTHLYSCVRHAMPVQGLAVNLCAALPSQCAAYPLLVLNDGSLWQTLALSALGIPSLLIGQRGTVTASAIELAFALSAGPVFLAGVDLSLNDIRTHARPYGFDHLLYGAANRRDPLYSLYFKRANGISGGQSLEIYAAWFRDRLKRWPKRIFALGPNPVFEPAPLDSLDSFSGEASGSAGGAAAGADFLKAQTVAHNAHNFRDTRNAAVNALLKALDEPRYAKTLQMELAGLLFPGKKNTAIGEIAEELAGFDSLRQSAPRYGKSNG